MHVQHLNFGAQMAEQHTDLETELAELPTLSLRKLRERWKETFRQNPPAAFGPDLLRRSIAYKIQENHYGGLSKDATRLLGSFVKALKENPQLKPKLSRRIKTGSELVRQWKGKSVRVIVKEQGFLFNGKAYGNLSEIAREVTGSRWNGPRFFGLRKPPETPAKIIQRKILEGGNT
jgi:hypothetical protein